MLHPSLVTLSDSFLPCRDSSSIYNMGERVYEMTANSFWLLHLLFQDSPNGKD